MLDDLLVDQSVRIVLRGVIEANSKAAKWVWRKFRTNLELPGERQELLKELFLGKGDFLFHPGSDWKPARGQSEPPTMEVGYPHDLNALLAFAPLLPKKTILKDDLYFEEKLTPTRHLVCTGSPKANALARSYLPSYELTEKGKTRQYNTIINPDQLQYAFGENFVDPTVKVISKMENGTIRDKTRKLIWKNPSRSDASFWYPQGYMDDEWLTKDFLLVSRLPRNSVGANILIFAGAHGAGTESVTLLMQKIHIARLRELVDLIGGTPYYQFVVEVTNIHHPSTGTMPLEAEISEKLPPVKLNLDSSALAKVPNKRRRKQ
jgi:hypothetical protein